MQDHTRPIYAIQSKHMQHTCAWAACLLFGWHITRHHAKAVRERENPQIQLVAKLDGNDRVQIDVIDNGTGIPAELVDSIFIPFFTTHKDGSGIGRWKLRPLICRPRVRGAQAEAQAKGIWLSALRTGSKCLRPQQRSPCAQPIFEDPPARLRLRIGNGKR